MFGALEAAQPQPLPMVDLPVRIRRDRGRIELEERVLPVREPLERSPRLRWCIEGTLLPDEMVLLIERPLDWTGPVSRLVRGLPLVEGAFPVPVALTRQCPELLGGHPRVAFPPGVAEVGWGYAAVLIRGDDTPWIRSGVLRLRRDG